jgi:hypothetical protein
MSYFPHDMILPASWDVVEVGKKLKIKVKDQGCSPELSQRDCALSGPPYPHDLQNVGGPPTKSSLISWNPSNEQS